MGTDPRTEPECWSCATKVPSERLRVESVLRTRSGADGGPFQSFRCSGCGAENGVLLDRHGRGLMYPLEGREEPGWLDRIIGVADGDRWARAAVWWHHHGERVQRFIDRARTERPRRASSGTPAPDRPRRPPRPERRTTTLGSDRPAASPGSALHDLGLPADASAQEIRKAFRRTLKRIHPDHVDQDDALAVAEANDAVRRLRAAYETALRAAGSQG